jgi:hypothetical protein
MQINLSRDFRRRVTEQRLHRASSGQAANLLEQLRGSSFQSLTSALHQRLLLALDSDIARLLAASGADYGNRVRTILDYQQR